AIGAGFDAGDADVVCYQEVLTYWHLRLLVRRMRSFRRVSYRPGPFGPYGGLVTFARRPVSGTAFRRFGRPPPAPGVPRTSRLQARLKGALVTRLARPELCVINTHRWPTMTVTGPRRTGFTRCTAPSSPCSPGS